MKIAISFVFFLQIGFSVFAQSPAFQTPAECPYQTANEITLKNPAIASFLTELVNDSEQRHLLEKCNVEYISQDKDAATNFQVICRAPNPIIIEKIITKSGRTLFSIVPYEKEKVHEAGACESFIGDKRKNANLFSFLASEALRHRINNPHSVCDIGVEGHGWVIQRLGFVPNSKPTDFYVIFGKPGEEKGQFKLTATINLGSTKIIDEENLSNSTHGTEASCGGFEGRKSMLLKKPAER